MKKIFAKMDHGKKGSIKYKHFKKFLQKVDKSLTSSKLSSLFKKINHSGNGSLTLKEFSKAFKLKSTSKKSLTDDQIDQFSFADRLFKKLARKMKK